MLWWTLLIKHSDSPAHSPALLAYAYLHTWERSSSTRRGQLSRRGPLSLTKSWEHHPFWWLDGGRVWQTVVTWDKKTHISNQFLIKSTYSWNAWKANDYISSLRSCSLKWLYVGFRQWWRDIIHLHMCFPPTFSTFDLKKEPDHILTFQV